MPSSMGAQITELLASTAEISNLMSVLSVLAALLVMLVFLTRLIYQVLAVEFLGQFQVLQNSLWCQLPEVDHGSTGLMFKFKVDIISESPGNLISLFP